MTVQSSFLSALLSHIEFQVFFKAHYKWHAEASRMGVFIDHLNYCSIMGIGKEHYNFPPLSSLRIVEWWHKSSVLLRNKSFLASVNRDDLNERSARRHLCVVRSVRAGSYRHRIFLAFLMSWYLFSYALLDSTWGTDDYLYSKETSRYFLLEYQVPTPGAGPWETFGYCSEGALTCTAIRWQAFDIRPPDSLSLKMLFIFLFTYALGRSIKAAPLALPSSSNEIQFRDVPTCDCSNGSNQRSLFDIIWGCIVTLFACTWISVHPNVPSLSDSRSTIIRRRIKIMICALIMPEGVMYWAMRQWLGSRKLARRYKGQ